MAVKWTFEWRSGLKWGTFPCEVVYPWFVLVRQCLPCTLLFLQDLSCRAVAVFTLHHTVKYRLHWYVAALCCPARPRTSSGHAAFPWTNDTWNTTGNCVCFGFLSVFFIMHAVERTSIAVHQHKVSCPASFTRRTMLVDHLVLLDYSNIAAVLVHQLDHHKPAWTWNHVGLNLRFLFTYILHISLTLSHLMYTLLKIKVLLTQICHKKNQFWFNKEPSLSYHLKILKVLHGTV